MEGHHRKAAEEFGELSIMSYGLESPFYDLFIDDKNINSSAFFSTDASGI